MVENRPYYGVLMKDGTEITHFGVKGMKWGKHIFGKVKGIFGKDKTLSSQMKKAEKVSEIQAKPVSKKRTGSKKGNSINNNKKTGVNMFYVNEVLKKKEDDKRRVNAYKEHHN